MKYSIVIVGAGQLGSRYLQGLAKYTEPLSIYVVDINPASLDTAKSRWLEVVNDAASHSVVFQNGFDLLPANVDLAIVSTSSNVREMVVSLLKKATTVRNWILEKVLTQNMEGLGHLETMIPENAWVNTFFRTLDWFKNIRNSSADGPMHLKVTGGNWGIACNTIHCIDFISWWTGESVTGFNTSHLDKNWFPAKRAGFWEINGTLQADFSGGSTGTFISDESDAPFELHIRTASEEWLIGWDNGTARSKNGTEIPGRVLYQSEMTAGLVRAILETGQCELPSLTVSAQQHRVFLDSLLAHWNQYNDKKTTLLPIT